jgi:hypothetical protein
VATPLAGRPRNGDGGHGPQSRSIGTISASKKERVTWLPTT